MNNFFFNSKLFELTKACAYSSFLCEHAESITEKMYLKKIKKQMN